MAELHRTDGRSGRVGPLRVGMVCPYSLSVPGGVQGQVLGLARALRQMGIEVRVLGPCDGPPPATFVTPLGNSLPTTANGSVAPLAPDPSAVLRTMRVLFEEQFDVLHLHEPFAPGPPMTSILLHPAPVVATFHAAGESASYKYLKAPIKAAAKNLVHQVVVSKDALALVQEYLGGEYEVLYNGVEIDLYSSAEPAAAPPNTIFFCGRHEERKGLDVLIEAMSRLGPDVHLQIASSGPDTQRLKAQTAGDHRIEWLGRIADEEKVARLRGASVFCAPSLRGESFGVVLIEAMAAGTCIVASSLDGYLNVATHDKDAYLVEPGDAIALADALRTVLGSPDLQQRLVAAGHRRAGDFSMAALARRYAEIYHDAVRTGPPPAPVSPWLLSPKQRRLGRMMGR
ncbi:MAG: glycosyltransferase family 4 protein [Actinomycetota bacterium]